MKIPSVDWRIAAGLVFAVVLAIGAFLFNQSHTNDLSRQRPPVMIMSSIPLQWGEATITEIAQGEAQTPALLEALAEKRRTVLIDDFQKLDKPGKAPLVLIQPRALAPRELVQLDDWIRGGGSALVFADPALDWPSDLPLGDLRRPLFTSMLTPLFRHWGLELALPVDEAQQIEVLVGSYLLKMKSAGLWRKTDAKKPAATCLIREDERLALCRVGKGQALLVADADLLDEAQWTGNLMSEGTIDWLNAVLSDMDSGNPLADKFWENAGK
jgi:hypothetical protein